MNTNQCQINNMQKETTIMLGEYGPYAMNCYYCHLPVTRDTHGWNAHNSEGALYLVHHACMIQEEKDICSTNDWERGERYSNAHTLTNPLSRRVFVAKCGCKVSMVKNDPHGKYNFSCIEHLCKKHKIFRWMSISIPFGIGIKKPLHTHYGNLFKEAYNAGMIDDPFHEQEFKIGRYATQ